MAACCLLALSYYVVRAIVVACLLALLLARIATAAPVDWVFFCNVLGPRSAGALGWTKTMPTRRYMSSFEINLLSRLTVFVAKDSTVVPASRRHQQLLLRLRACCRTDRLINQVIAGQGTIGMEILKERNGRALDIVFCCCGGGGLVAGVAAYIKQVRPEVKVRLFRPLRC